MSSSHPVTGESGKLFPNPNLKNKTGKLKERVVTPSRASENSQKIASRINKEDLFNPTQHSIHIKANKMVKTSIFWGIVAKIKAFIASWFGKSAASSDFHIEMEEIPSDEDKNKPKTQVNKYVDERPKELDKQDDKFVDEQPKELDEQKKQSDQPIKEETSQGRKKNKQVENALRSSPKEINPSDEAKKVLANLKMRIALQKGEVKDDEVMRAVSVLDRELTDIDFEKKLELRKSAALQQKNISFLDELAALEKRADAFVEFDKDSQGIPWFPKINQLGQARKDKIQGIREAFKQQLIQVLLMSEEQNLVVQFNKISNDIDAILVQIQKDDRKGQPLLERLTVAKQEIEAKFNELKTIQQKVAVAEQEVKDITERSAVQTKENQRLESAIGGKEALQKKYQNKISELEKELEEAKSVLIDQAEEIKSLEEEFETLKNKTTEKETILKNAEDRHAELKNSLEGLKNQKTVRSKLQYVKTTAEIPLLEGKIQQTQGLLRIIRDRMEENQAQLKKFKSPLENCVRSLDSFSKEIKKIENSIQNNREQITKNKTEMERLNQELFKKKKSLDVAQKKLKSWTDRFGFFEDLFKQIEAIEVSMTQLHNQVNKQKLLKFHLAYKMVEGYPDITEENARKDAYDTCKNNYGMSF
ncbi:MAG: hypothetical protein KDK55_00925 [Chlamydiia bacterium]|nr:hypothetical protein [Chlamydiia bacterium]